MSPDINNGPKQQEKVFMKRKVLFILVVSLISLSGCHDSVQLTRDRFIAQKPHGSVVILTNDMKYYQFQENAYWFTNDSLKGTGTLTQNGHISTFAGSIPLADIEMIETEELNTTKTVLCVLGVTAAVVVTAAMVIAIAFAHAIGEAADRSCPFVYTFDGSNFHFESETFSGAVFKGLERTSYDNLHFLKPVDGLYHLKVSNERRETQYINEMKLLVIDHPESTSIIPDLRGTVHTITHPRQPLSCVDLNGHDLLPYIVSSDSVYWESDLSTKDFSKESDLRDGMILEFPKPQNASTAKLFVCGVNTGLGGFAFQKLFELKGTNKLLWYHQLEHDSSERAKFLGWMMREGMLHVKIWQNAAWKEVTAFADGGPLIPRDQVALLNLENFPDTTLRVRLECTTDLWRIDQVSIDYSTDEPVRVTELAVASAINEQSQDVAKLLSSADDQYYMTVQGQHADILYREIPRQPGMERSYVLKTRGFYYQWIPTQGQENKLWLEKVLTEPRFGAKQYLPEWQKIRLGQTKIQR